jgi:HEAT repeat protein
LSSPQRLGELLGAPSISTKMRALEMVGAMGAADSVIEHLAPLVTHADPAVRTEAVAILGTCRHADPLPLLREAEQDPVSYVRDAASRSIDDFVDRVAGTPIFDTSLEGDVP